VAALGRLPSAGELATAPSAHAAAD
jgi:hypothetical protein